MKYVDNVLYYYINKIKNIYGVKIMKKRDDIDDEIIDDIDDEVVDDEIVDDEIVDDEVEDVVEVQDDEEEDADYAMVDAPSGKGLKSNQKKTKKKLGKGAKAGIITAVVVVVLVVAFIVEEFFLGLAGIFGKKTQIVAGQFDLLLSLNGYNQEPDISSIKLKEGATEDHIISVSEMLTESGISGATGTGNTEFAAALYSLAVTNYRNVNGTGWNCYTDSDVYAKDVKATVVVTVSFDSFNVGVRAAYNQGNMQSNYAAHKAAGIDNYFSQTISGVTKLDIGSVPSSITDALKSNFGYNNQEFLYDNVYALRRGVNGGATFYGNTDPEGYYYLMGAYNETFEDKCFNKFTTNDPKSIKTEQGYDQKASYIHYYDAETDAVAKDLDYIETPANVINTSRKAWDTLNTYYQYAYKLKPYDLEENYYAGNYGTGWAAYDFRKEYLDDSTEISYDKKTGVYTINYVVKEEKVDDACVFAKGSLIKDTKDYIMMQKPTYTLQINKVEIWESGLIKSWERQETVASEEKAKLVVIPGTCYGGGGTTNHTYQTFSYEEIDYSPLALAARVWPQIGQDVAGEYKQDLSSYMDFDTYKTYILKQANKRFGTEFAV